MEYLTGLELNLFERAGYVIRRGFPNSDAASEAILGLCRDILGKDVESEAAAFTLSSSWRRAGGAPIDTSNSELARLQYSVIALCGFPVPVSVVPGSHLDSWEPANIESTDSIPGQIGLKLEADDLAILSPTIVWRWEEAGNPREITGLLVKRRRV